MRLVGESIYQKGSLSMHPIMAAPLLALSLAGLAVPAAAQPRDGASDGVERADAGDDFYCAERRLGQWFYCSKPRATEPEKQAVPVRSGEHTSELQSLMRISYAVFCLKKNKNTRNEQTQTT